MYQRFIKAVVVPLFLLLLPYFAMQLTNHIKWSTFDFFVMALLLILTSLSINFALVYTQSLKKWLIIIIIVLLFLLLYTELAVGIFNSPFAGD